MQPAGPKGKVLLAFSGGIDSSYCVYKLRKEGYDVEGLILDMMPDGGFTAGAAARAESLGLSYEILDVSRDFKASVIDYFTGEYLQGRTPAPCTVCNPEIKWKYLYERALEKGFDNIATGHYFRKEEINGRFYVRKALDPAKDQSYYLWMLPQEILRMALTPMGYEIKKELAGSIPGSPRESMGVCFLRNRDYRDFIRESHPDHRCCGPGNIIDNEGNIIGTHEGTAFYTIGQKKGLGLPPAYSVVGINAADNTVTAGTKVQPEARNLLLENYNLSPDYPPQGRVGDLRAVIRGYGINPEGNCSLRENEGLLEVTLDNPAWAPANGQPVVLYDRDVVIGGGFIRHYH